MKSKLLVSGARPPVALTQSKAWLVIPGQVIVCIFLVAALFSYTDLLQGSSKVVCEASPGCAREMWGGDLPQMWL